LPQDDDDDDDDGVDAAAAASLRLERQSLMRQHSTVCVLPARRREATYDMRTDLVYQVRAPSGVESP